MKKIIAVSAAVLAFATSAVAADLPVKAPPSPVDPGYNWTGF